MHKKDDEGLARTYKCLAIETGYWRTGTDYIEKIVASVRGKIKDDDFVTVSEKAISTASGNIIDESKIRPSVLASFLAKHWMQQIWGYPLGIICHLRARTVTWLRQYPPVEGAKHKQVALN